MATTTRNLVGAIPWLLWMTPLLLGGCVAATSDELSVSEHGLIETSLTASANPCITNNGASTCTTSITATSAYGASQQVWVSMDGAAPTNFACLSSGASQSANWIQVGHTYRFSLHPSASCDVADRGVEAGSVIVTGHRARIIASVNPCSAAPGGTCASELSWQSGYNAPKHQLWVAGGSAPITCNVKGTTQRIAAGATVNYELYTATGTACNATTRGTLVATLQVRGLSDRAVRSGNKILFNGAELRMVGLNKHELIEQRMGYAEGNYVQDLQDAANAGFTVIRMRAAPYWPVWLEQWQNETTREAFWDKMDDVINAAGSRGIKLIPSILWNPFVFADAVHEPLHAMFDMSQPSAARTLLYEFTAELIERYKDNPTVLMWELTNELNLMGDVDIPNDAGISEFWGSPAARTDADNVTSDEMIVLMRDLATLIRGLDPSRLIGSGYAYPRPAAGHLRAGAGWTVDNESEMRSYMATVHQDPIDVVSVHFYNDADAAISRFGAVGAYNPEVLGNYVAAADAIGKPLMLGEHGDTNPKVSTDGHGNWSRATLLRALEQRVPISLTWTWKNTVNGNPGPYSIYPGGTPAMTQLIAFHNSIKTWFSTAPAARAVIMPVTNPSFSLDNDSNGVPDGWTVATAPSTVRFATPSEPRFDGNTMRLHGPPGGATMTSSLMPVTGGSKLIVSAAVKAELAGGGSAQFGIQQLYSGGGGLLTVLPLQTDSSFGIRATQIQLQPTANQVQIFIYTTGGGILYVDDVRLSRQ